MKDFSPLMLTLARESRKLSQTALAKAVGVTQSAISQMEAGLISPSEEVAVRLGEELKYSPSLFFTTIPVRELPLTFFRKKARVGVREVTGIRARVNLYRFRLSMLLKSYELDGPRIALSDLVAEGITASEAAQRLRVYWNVAPGPIRDLTALVESAGIFVVAMDFGTAAVDGLSIYEPNDTLPPTIFLNRVLPADRWRLTLAHELGHIVLHHHLNIPPLAHVQEDEAFEFASELLAPTRELSGQLARLDMARLAALKRHWRISMAAIVMRAKKLDRLSDRQERTLWMQLGAGGRAESVTIDAERPALLRTVVEFHLNQLGYSARQLSDLLHYGSEEFRADFGLNSAPLRLA